VKGNKNLQKNFTMNAQLDIKVFQSIDLKVSIVDAAVWEL
jgi:hypothetical protein